MYWFHYDVCVFLFFHFVNNFSSRNNFLNIDFGDIVSSRKLFQFSLYSRGHFLIFLMVFLIIENNCEIRDYLHNNGFGYCFFVKIPLKITINLIFSLNTFNIFKT